MYKVELTKFRVKPGKSKKVDRWLKYIQENMEGVIRNVEGEKVYVETIFREAFNDVEYLYWYTIQDKEAAESETTSPIDQTHIDFFEDCIDHTFHPEDMVSEVLIIPDRIKKAMQY
ncbi:MULTISPECIES: DUF6176 family protein [Nosocomiicoccus]|uniref:DUF6176 family protein n=1 Tax=Nosocomiicoccus massiliensis TaxID=1232430 RepID=A0AAF0YNM0_9STAP|nr:MULTISPECIES: DUF6176 family protein [Nosocomiicoccus]MDK6863516.1 DUF6176 family protein [Nosocomiicoccus ampullae]OFO52142.1 hypothetical protein HMPREF3029_06630 [Nosocomiicoccus sp. HMSC059G07]OFS64625.1 hypothetical protein HMPREF3177_00380 [Nosocomiicoccus sp. HMSC09A07]WOS96819.1 DUF6176 family protein [Nosocomiicoccus massiliensis]